MSLLRQMKWSHQHKYGSFQDLSENEERRAEQGVKTQKVGGGTDSGHICKFNSKRGEMILM